MVEQLLEAERHYVEVGFREFASDLVRAFRAANRTSEADRLATVAMGLDPSPEMSAAIAAAVP